MSPAHMQKVVHPKVCILFSREEGSDGFRFYQESLFNILGFKPSHSLSLQPRPLCRTIRKQQPGSLGALRVSFLLPCECKAVLLL